MAVIAECTLAPPQVLRLLRNAFLSHLFFLRTVLVICVDLFLMRIFELLLSHGLDQPQPFPIVAALPLRLPLPRVIKQLDCRISAQLPALSNLLDHIVPILLLNHAFKAALADTLLVDCQMAEAVVLEMESELKLFCVSAFDLDAVSCEPEFGLAVEKKQIVVYPGHFLAA